MYKILYITTNNLDEFVGIEIRHDEEGIYLNNGYIPFSKINTIKTVGLINKEMAFKI